MRTSIRNSRARIKGKTPEQFLEFRRIESNANSHTSARSTAFPKQNAVLKQSPCTARVVDSLEDTGNVIAGGSDESVQRDEKRLLLRFCRDYTESGDPIVRMAFPVVVSIRSFGSFQEFFTDMPHHVIHMLPHIGSGGICIKSNASPPGGRDCLLMSAGQNTLPFKCIRCRGARIRLKRKGYLTKARRHMDKYSSAG